MKKLDNIYNIKINMRNVTLSITMIHTKKPILIVVTCLNSHNVLESDFDLELLINQ